MGDHSLKGAHAPPIRFRCECGGYQSHDRTATGGLVRPVRVVPLGAAAQIRQGAHAGHARGAEVFGIEFPCDEVSDDRVGDCGDVGEVRDLYECVVQRESHLGVVADHPLTCWRGHRVGRHVRVLAELDLETPRVTGREPDKSIPVTSTLGSTIISDG